MTSERRRPAGFTLIELIVVVAIVGALIALLLPAIQVAREAARRVQCLNNLRQQALGLWNYQEAQGAMPPGYVSTLAREGSEVREVGPGWGWMAQVLPYVEQGPLHREIRFDLGIEAPENSTVRSTNLSTMVCPSSPSWGPVEINDGLGKRSLHDLAASQYVGVGGLGDDRPEGLGVFVRNQATAPSMVEDGLSQTFLLGERSRFLAPASWVGAPAGMLVCRQPDTRTRDCRASRALVLGYAGPLSGGAPGVATPNHPRAGADGFAGYHQGGSQFALADASARFVSETINPAVFAALVTRAGGELISDDGW